MNVENVSTKVMISTSNHELAYRNKHYHDIRVVEKKQMTCASCGTQLNLESKKIFSHPILGTLQCEKCKICFENEDLVTDSDCINQYCYLCGRQCNSLYICSSAKCPYGFCKKCIKRNVRECLQDAESEDWKCFVCNIKPFWKLRAICAAVTTALVKKPRRNKFSQCDNNDREDGSSESENSDNEVIFKKTNRGSVYRKQLAHTKKIVKASKEDPSGSKLSSTSTKNEFNRQEKLNKKKRDVEKLNENLEVDDNKKKSLQRLNVTKNQKRNFIQDSDLTEKDEAIQDSRKITRLKKSETYGKHKSLRSVHIQTDDDECYERRNANNKKEKKQRVNVSETEMVERNYVNARTSRGESKNSRYENQDSDVEENEYHQEDKVPKSKRLITSSKDRSMRAKRDPYSKQSEKKEIQCSNNKHGKEQKSLLLRESESEKEYSEEDKSKHSRKSEVLFKKRIKEESRSYNYDSEEEETKIDMKISKQMLEKTRKNDTESSSGKEFQKSTLFERRHRPMRKLYTIDEGNAQGNKKRLITSQIELTDKKKLMTRKQRLTLKAYMKRLLNELKVLCSKFTSDTEKLNQKYCTKELIRVDDAVQMVLRSKDLVCGYKVKLDELETEFVKSCNTWCRECDMKNIFAKPNCVSVYDSMHSPVKRMSYDKWKMKEELEDEEGGDEDEANVNINKRNGLARCSTPVENTSILSTDELKNDSDRCESRLSRKSNSIVQKESCDSSDSSQSLKNIKTETSSVKNRCERLSEGDRSTSCSTEIFTAGSKHNESRCSDIENKSSNENAVEVSECDSEEIFSESEAQMSRLRSIARKKKEQMNSTTEQLRDKSEITVDSADNSDRGKILKKVKRLRKRIVQRLDDSDASSTNSDGKSVEPTAVDQLEGEKDTNFKKKLKDNMINKEGNENKEESMEIVCKKGNGKEETSLYSDLKLANDDFILNGNNQNDTSLNDLFDSSVDKDKDEGTKSSTLIQTEDTQFKEGDSTMRSNAESKDNTKTYEKENRSKTENILETNHDNSDSSSNDSNLKSSKRDIGQTRKGKVSQFENELSEEKRRDSKHDSMSSDEEDVDTVLTQNLRKKPQVKRGYVGVDQDISDIVTSTEEEALKLQDSENDKRCANELLYSDTDSENSKEPDKGKKCGNDEKCSTKVLSVASSQISNDKSELKSRSSDISSKCSFEENLKTLDSDVDSTCSTVVILDLHKEKQESVDKRKSGDVKEKNKRDSKGGSSDDDEKDLLEEKLSEKQETTVAKQLGRGILDSSSNESDCEKMSVKEKHRRRNEDLDEVNLNLRAKEALLGSSSSLSDVSDQSFKSESSFKSSDSDLHFTRSSRKRHCDINSDTSTSSKLKRKRFKPDKNLYSKVVDKKLKMVCKVLVKRLEQKDLDRHLHILRKSKQHQERKAFKSLLDLDNLEKRHRKNVSNSDDDSSSKSLRESKKKKKNTAEKEKEDTLMDHLEKVENGEIIERSDDESADSNIDMEKILKPYSTAKEDLMSEANKIAKNLLLNSSSDSDDGEEDEEEESNNDNDKVVNRTKDKSNDKEESGKEEVIELDENCSEDEEESQKRKDKSQWRRDKVLTAKLTESDSDLEEIKWNKSRKNHEKEDERSNSSSNDNAVTVKRRERRVRRKVLQSDSDSRKLTDVNDDSDSAGSIFEIKSSKYPKSKESEDTDDNWTKRAKRAARTSSSDSSVEKIRVKPKRRRIKVVTNDSDSDSDDITSSQGGPGNSSRKNIRKVLKDKQVADNTKQAAKEEEERLKRIAERQKLYNEMYELRLAGEERVNKLVLDFDEETKEELVSVHKDLVKRLKPHQAQGIKFMWDACFESVKRVTSSKGSGCIIAHCMGLGKTLQVVTLAYTLLTHEETGIKTIMVVCPLSTILNWVHEFKMWLKGMDDENEINIFELTKMKKNFERKYQLEEWQRCGGVLMIGYEMFRNLTTRSTKVRKGIQEAILKCLVDPGADLVVCDEGHLLKNEDTALSKAMKRIKTLRRVVLTGTPLQNNLIEYHCMVQFVKPNLLGTKKEFMNRFVNPITNGQFDDSTELDVKLMKKRAHVLHKMLEGSIQRFDYGVLTPFLPPKQEYVIFVKLTECQTKLYRYYLEHLARRSRSQGGSLFADFQQLQRIWTHPFVLKLNAEKVERMNEKKRLDESDSEGSLKDFIDDSSDDSSVKSSSSSSNGSGSKDNAQKHVTAANPNDEPEPTKQDNVEEEDWWVQFIQQENIEDLRLSAKLVLLFGILKECEQIGDKALVFSQSLYSLTLIEKFLDQVDNETQNDCESELVDGHTGSWSIGLDYFRLDGQTSAENRSHWCRIFNNPSNTRARLFLISTKAGGLGINLTAANRVIIFDASWNPSHDVQSIFRVYRFGQKKPCYIYRFLASGTMEEKIYNRQVTKLSLSCRVVDEQQIERHYSNNDLTELYRFEPPEDDVTRTLNLPKDRLLAEIFLKHKNIVQSYHEHDSLLENKAEEELDEEERKQAWLEYEEEKKGRPQVYYPPMTTSYQHNLFMQQCNMMLAQQQNAMAQNVSPMHIDYENLQHLISKDFPNQTEEQRKILTSRIVMQMYNYAEKQIMNQAPRNLMPNLNAPYSMMNNPSTAGLNSANTQQYMQQQPQLHRLLQHKQLNTRGSVTNPAVVANPVINNMRVTDDEVMEILPTPAATSSKTNRQTSVSNSNNKGHEE